MKAIKKIFKVGNVYIVCVLVFLASLVFYSPGFQVPELVKTILSLPLVGSLIGILIKAWNDERLQNAQQDFMLGTASHMAQFAYDKHAGFCEEYMNEIQKVFRELLKNGPSTNCLSLAHNLVQIREKYSAWLTTEIEQKLKPFEEALISIGAHEQQLRLSTNLSDEQRTKTVEAIFKPFELVLGIRKPLNEQEAEMQIERVTEKLRDILGIKALTKLRINSASLALERLDV